MVTSGAAIAPASPSPSRYPLALAYCSVAFLAGLFWTSAGLPLAVLTVPAVTVSLLLLPAGRWQLALLVLACGVATFLGAWRSEATRYHDGPGKIAHYIGRSAVLVAVVDGEPQPGGHGENFQVNVESAQISGHPIHAFGQVLVHYTGAQHVEYGDRLTLTGRLLQPFSAPGFDYRAYLARRGVFATIDFPLLRIDARGVGNPIQGFALHLRDILRHTIDGMLPHDEAALLIGILLGAPTKSLGTLTALFVSTGMIHIVAISGLKVALVAGVLSGLCARLPARIRWAPALVGVCLYTLV
ncbi:MAG: putative Competence protein ComEC [Chloroflexi bacterium]|nr:putative Competence protein ComEC [Chloroflexota bacterium]